MPSLRLRIPALTAVLVTVTVAGGLTGSGPAEALAASRGGGGSYRVVGFGDSVPSGSNCGCTNYVTLATRALARRYGEVAVLHNLARGSQTTAGVLAQLRDPVVRTEVADSDLVVITVGANDFPAGKLMSSACRPAPATSCYRAILAAQRIRLDAILAQVRSLQARHGGSVVVTGYWNVFLDGVVARRLGSGYVRASTSLTVADNAMIASVARARSARYVDLYRAFRGNGSVDDTRLLASDGDHPNAAGHRVIAAAVVAAVPN